MPQRELNRPPRPTRPPPPPPPTQTWELQTQLRLEAPLTNRQLKRRRNKDSKLNKKFKSLGAEINSLKS